METQFEQACSRFLYSGLLVASLTDRDGVIILKCMSEKANESMVEPIIPTTFAIANNQASKLTLKRNKSIISVCNKYQIIQLDQAPFIITLVAESSANTGLFMNLGNELLELTKPLVDMVNEQA
ncbi:MAG: Ragulator complex protein LAMTOR3 [Benjaminiella poitrasii]|nr:MAG: Ragulator complex protein LAMTOR3 [Benjaminiella poitrasii]